MLMSQNPAFAFAALLAGVMGVASLYLSWRKRGSTHGAAVFLGWSLVAASVWLWIAFGGAEFGPVLALAQLSVIAWVFVFSNKHVRPDRGKAQQPGAVGLPRAQALARHAFMFLVAVPLAGVSVTFLVVASSRLIPWSDLDRMAFSILAIPVVWGLAVYWTCADPRLLRPAVGIVAGGSAAAAFIFT